MRINILDFIISLPENDEITKLISKRYNVLSDKDNKNLNLKVNFIYDEIFEDYTIIKKYTNHSLNNIGFTKNNSIIFNFRMPNYILKITKNNNIYIADFFIYKKVKFLHQFRSWDYTSISEQYAYSIMNILDVMILFINLSLDKKTLLFHSSGISYNNKGFLFAGVSNIGKTSLVLNLLNEIESSKFLTEDMAYINAVGETVIDPRDFRVYQDVVKYNPILLNKMFSSNLDKINWKLYSLKKGNRQQRRLINPLELFQNKKIEDKKIEINKIFVLLNDEYSNVSKQTLINWLALNSLDDFIDYILAFDFLILANPILNNTFLSYSQLYNNYVEELYKLYDNVEFYTISVKDRNQAIQKIKDIIRDS